MGDEQQQEDSALALDDKIVGVWFLATGPGVDWMASVREIQPDERYQLSYRFRYHKDDKPFDSDDEKHWYKAEIRATRQYVILGIRSTGKQLEAMGAESPLYEYLNDKGFDEFWERFQNAPFVFVRQEKKA
jgi:hypothetical protein